MINILVDWQDVSSGIIAALRMLLLKICDPIYSLITFCFDIFEDFGKVRLFENSDTISLIYTRVGLILGLFMIFRLTFAAIEYLINPDKMTDSKAGIGNIIKKVLIVVILLGSTRFLFNFVYNLQNKLIDSNIVGNIILGPSYSSNEKVSAGTNIAWYTFSQFYRLNDEIETVGAANEENYTICQILLKTATENDSTEGTIIQDFKSNHSLEATEYCVNLQTDGKYTPTYLRETTDKVKLNIIDFNGFICLAVGIILLWIIVTYTVQVGVRVFQLAYLELIAPIPIMMYLMPNGEEKLKKWGQQCLTTFLDFFIRLAIMDFIILISNSLIELTDQSFLGNFSTDGVWSDGYIIVILIVALFIFAKKVPNLLKEIFPSTGSAAGFDFGLKMPKEAKQVGLFGAGAVLGGAGAAASNLLHSTATGIKGIKDAQGTGNKWKAGLKGFGKGFLSVAGGAASGMTHGARIKNMRGVGETIKTTNQNRDKRDLKQAAGYKPWHAAGDKVLGFAGLDTKADTMIKEAQWQQQAAEASRSAIWKNAEDLVKNGTLSYEDYSFARSLRQDKDKSGNTIWRGLDKSGKEITIKDVDLQAELARRTTSGIDLSQEVRDNASVDERIKKEGKKIKGLEAANDAAKK